MAVTNTTCICYECGNTFEKTSKNARKKACSVRCAQRAGNRRHRLRKRLQVIRVCIYCANLIGTFDKGKASRICATCMPAHQRARNARKKCARKYRLGVSARLIDPMEVFIRDQWKCHICKRKTQEKLRGTFSSLSPELDHIVALSDGGKHTWSNVSCACRECNLRKGANSFGQMNLGFRA